jgi:ribosomal protein S18 acetylase RimI-like enzyme
VPNSVERFGLNIRVTTIQDLPAVLALTSRLAAGVPPGRDPRQVAAIDSAVMRRALTHPAPDEVLLVAEEHQTVLGFIHLKTVTDYYSQQPIAHVSDVVVDAAAEGRGVGKGLMSAAEQWARAQGYRLIQLNVLVDNSRARSMYERLGYSAEWLKYIKPID